MASDLHQVSQEVGEGGEVGGEEVQVYIKQRQQVISMIQWVMMMMMKKFTILWMMTLETHSPAIYLEVGGVEAGVGIIPGQVEAGVGIILGQVETGVGIPPGHPVDQVDQFQHNNLNTDPRSR